MDVTKVKFPPMPLFRLSTEVLQSLSNEEVDATLMAMAKCGITAHPFEEFAIEAKNAHLLYDDEWISKEDEEFFKSAKVVFLVRYKFNSLDDHRYKAITVAKYGNNSPVLGCPPYCSDEMYETIKALEKKILRCLLALLVTKNADKKTIENHERAKNHQAREDAKRKFTSTTVIKIGKITETLEGHGLSGKQMRPHLRRGHVRNQRHGEGRAEVKKVFIAPVFVNADKGWVNTDKVYKVVA